MSDQTLGHPHPLNSIPDKYPKNKVGDSNPSYLT